MAVAWAALADTIPIYPLYAVLFADTGLSGAQISSLFIVWSAMGIVAEVPSGALADRFSRRATLVASALLQAGGYACWMMAPGYLGFAAGFVLWGLGGAFSSGALEALLYDGLAAHAAQEQYPRLYGRITAVGLLSQVPAAAAASVLYGTGGYALVGWVSVGCCLAAAAAATRLPEARRTSGAPSTAGSDEHGDQIGGGSDHDGGTYLGILEAGLGEVARNRGVQGAILAVAVLGSLDGLEEYFSLLAQDWGVATSAVPVAVLTIPLAGATGAAVGGRTGTLRPYALAAALVVAVGVSAGVGLLRRPVGVAGIAFAYCLYRLVLVVTDARLQQRIESSSRATVTSVASLATDLCAIALYALWALDLAWLVVVVTLALAAGLPRLLRAGANSVPTSEVDADGGEAGIEQGA